MHTFSYINSHFDKEISFTFVKLCIAIQFREKVLMRGKVQFQVQVLVRALFCQCQERSRSTSCKFHKSILAEEHKGKHEPKEKLQEAHGFHVQGVNHLLLGHTYGLTDQRDERAEFV